MRIPKNISLRAYILGLIRENKIEKFYVTEDWRELRADVLEFFHYECQECLKTGKYTRAECVHHVNEVRVRPDLALSRYYVDNKGVQQYQLVPLCNACHNVAHPEKFGHEKRFINDEKW